MYSMDHYYAEIRSSLPFDSYQAIFVQNHHLNQPSIFFAFKSLLYFQLHENTRNNYDPFFAQINFIFDRLPLQNLRF